MPMEKFNISAQLYDCEERFHGACHQIELLKTRLREMTSRYSHAKNYDYKTFRYIIRIRIMVIEGLIASYYKYACRKRKQAYSLRRQLYGEDLDISDDDDSNGEDI